MTIKMSDRDRMLARKGIGKVGKLPVPSNPTDWHLFHRDGREHRCVARTAFEACKNANWTFSDIVLTRYLMGKEWVSVQ